MPWPWRETFKSLLVTSTPPSNPNDVDGTIQAERLVGTGPAVFQSITVTPTSPYTPNAFAGSINNIIIAQIVGDGVADDSVPINAAIATAPATGATIIIPSTTINIARCGSTVLVNKANILLWFMGGITLKAKNSLNADVLKITASNVLLLDGIIDGNKTNNASGNGINIDCTTPSGLVSGVTLFNTAIQSCAGFGVNIQASGLNGAVSGTNLIEGTNVTDTNTGIFVNGRAAAGGTVNLTTVRNCIVNTTFQHGVVSTGANRTIIEGSSFLNVGLNKASGFAHAIAIDGNGGSNANSGHRIVNNYALNPADAGIEIADSVNDVVIAGNHINGSGHGPNMTNSYGIFFGGALALSLRCTITGNDVINAVGDSYRVIGVDGTHLTDHVSVVGNVSSAPGANHLTLTNVGTDVHVYGNPGFAADIQATNNAVITVTGDIVTNPSGAMRPFSDGLHDIGASALRYKKLWLNSDLVLGVAPRILTTGTVPTVGSGGAGTSALSILANSTNTSGRFQVTLTAVAPGVVAGVVAFGGAPLSTAPLNVVCSLSAPTAGVASPPIVGADTFTTSGFTVRVYGPTTVTTGTYVINFWVSF